MWDTNRINEEHALKAKYGLRKVREVWLAESELKRIRKNVREILAGRLSDETGRQIIARLARYGIVAPTANLDELLSLNVDSLLERRLQTVIYKKGLARTLRQARQLITHGFIAINGKKVTTPSYMVSTSEESTIGYYKPIDITPQQQQSAQAEQAQQNENAENENAEKEEGNEGEEAS